MFIYIFIYRNISKHKTLLLRYKHIWKYYTKWDKKSLAWHIIVFDKATLR